MAHQQLLLHREIQDTLFPSLLPAIRLDRATRPAGFAIVYTLLKHPTRFSHPRSFSMPVWHLPADCLTFFLGRRGSICHCVGAVHNTGAVVCDMGWDGMALPYRDYLICTVQSTRCIRSTQPTGSLVRRPLFPLRPTSPALFLWPLGFSPSAGRHATGFKKSSFLVARDLPRRLELYRQTLR